MALVDRKAIISGLIANFKTNTQKNGRAGLTAGFLRGRRECLERYWAEFQENHGKLSELPDLRDNAYSTEDWYSTAEFAYTTALGFIYDEVAKLAPVEQAAGRQLPGTGSLPKISLPSFSGQQEEWEPFRDLFRSLIHLNGGLSGVQKLHYLKTSVLGDAKRALDSHNDRGKLQRSLGSALRSIRQLSTTRSKAYDVSIIDSVS